MTSCDRDVAVIIGASNVSRGLGQLVEVLATRHQRPLNLFVTAGHGRSYGVTSLIGVRSLPSIIACGLWRELDSQRAANPNSRLSAMITDVGNDLIYGFPPETVAEWVKEVARRLAARNAKLAIVRLPLASVTRASELRYLAMRAAFSPWLKLNFAQMKEAATVLDQNLQDIAREFGADIIDQPGHWYGLDVIHIRSRKIHELWNAACEAWGIEPATGASPRPLKFGELIGLHLKAAEKRSLFGVRMETAQPCYHCQWSDHKDVRVWMH